MSVKDTHVVDTLYPKVEAQLSNPNNVRKLMKFISDYMDRNNHILFDLNFSDRLIISDRDQSIIFTVTNTTEQEVDRVIAQSIHKIGKYTWVTRPFTVMMAMAIRYFTIRKMKKEAEICIVFLSFLYYTLAHTSSFKFLPNKEIMDYTLNKNPKVTNSFKIKQQGTVFGMIRYTSTTSHDFHEKDLIGECTDVELNNYLSAIRTRLRSNLKNLAKYFYEDHEAGHYLNKDSDSFEEDKYHMADSTMLAISKLASKVSTKLVSHGFDRVHINRSAGMDINVSQSKLAHMVDTIIEKHRLELDKFISSVIELYVLEGNNSIREVSSTKFVAHSMNLYKTNSTKPKVIEIKEYLDRWIESGTEKFGNKIVRAATVNAYRKCLFIVFVYAINKDAK